MKLKQKVRIGFIGAGNMAEAIISAIIKSGIPSGRIIASDVNSKRLNYIRKKYKIKSSLDNSDTVKSSDVIFLAVKPFQVKEVLEKIKDYFNGQKLVVSIAAGIKTSKIEKYLKKTAVIRVMPNTAALIGEGAIALSAGKRANKADIKLAEKLLSSCGTVVTVKEKDMDAVTAVSGSGPAYVFYVTEIMGKTAEKMGLSKETAKKLVNQTLLGASKMLIATGECPDILRQKVTSKGGTTEAAFKVLSNKKFADIFESAIFSAMKKSKELSNG